MAILVATERFNQNIITVSKRLQDARSPATILDDTGKRYTIARLEQYENRAIRDFVRDKFKELGTSFGTDIPEMIKTSGNLPTASGVVVKPGDAWRVLTLRTEAGLRIDRIPDDEVDAVRTGTSLINPVAARPGFWEEGENLYLIPSSVSGNVIARYIISHQDIAVITTAAGNGKWNTANGTWAALTRKLTATMNNAFIASDKNKRIAFRDATTARYGFIESFVDADEVIVNGNALPTSDIAVVAQVMVIDLAETTDILLDPTWDSEIVDRMFVIAKQDVSANANA